MTFLVKDWSPRVCRLHLGIQRSGDSTDELDLIIVADLFLIGEQYM
jgi:hypothetical protein